MKIRLLANAFALLLACQWTGAALADSAPLEVKSNDQPSVSFLRPVKDERFFDYPIFVQVQVAGFNLIPPQEQHGAVPANTGHIEYSMDDYPVCTTEDTQVMIGKKLGNGYLPTGLHVIKAQLVDVNGNSLKPPVAAITQVFSGHPAPVEVIHKTESFGRANLTAEELYQIETQLDELQNELRKIETGNAGFVPMSKSAAGDSQE